MKNPTQWFTPERRGEITFTTGFAFQDNLGNDIIDNLGNDIIVTPLIVVPQPSTLWNDSTAFYAILDEMSLIIEDEGGSPIEDESTVIGALNSTQWFNPSRRGSVINIGQLLFQDNLGNSIIDNRGDNLVTTSLESVKQPSTEWAEV